jgi:catalase
MLRFPVVFRLAVRGAAAVAITGGASIFALAQDTALQPSQSASVKTTPNQMIDDMHQAFGAHHDRAVHTKGVLFLGIFTPDPAALALTKAPIFAGGDLPVQARFSLFSGIPDIPDTDGGAAPTGLAIKIEAGNGESYDLASDQHNGFIVATVDEFAEVMRDVGASGPGVAHPTPIEQFIGTHPAAKAFVTSLTQPASYAEATFFGINSFKWTNAQGKSIFVRYRYVPRAGEHYLSKDELKPLGPNYLQDEIVARIAKAPVVFDWYVQIAESGDKIEDPSAVWPESRKLVKVGTFTITQPPADPLAADKAFTVLPGSSRPGIDPADPMLTFRNQVYPVSFKARQ